MHVIDRYHIRKADKDDYIFNSFFILSRSPSCEHAKDKLKRLKKRELAAYGDFLEEDRVVV